MASRRRSGAYKPRAYKSSYKPRAYKSPRKGRDGAKLARTVLVGLLVVAVVIVAVTVVLNKKKTSGGNAAQTITGPTLPPTAPQRVAANTDLGQVALASEQGRGTVRLTYAAQGSGIPSKITLEEMPPDELFKWPGNELVTDGKHLFSCTVAPAAACGVPGPVSSRHFKSMIALFNASTYVGTIAAWQSVVSSGTPHFTVSLTQHAFARQNSECITWVYERQSVNYCITDNGIVTFVGVAGTSAKSDYTLRLTSYSTKVPTSDFRKVACRPGSTITSAVCHPHETTVLKATASPSTTTGRHHNETGRAVKHLAGVSRASARS